MIALVNTEALSAHPASYRTQVNPQVTFEPLSGNRAIETAAVLWVIQVEREAGRDAQDRRSARGFPGDIESLPRIIEVKAVGGDARGADLPLEVTQVERARVDPNFYLYLVDRIAQGNPEHFRLKVFGGERAGYSCLSLPVGVSRTIDGRRRAAASPALAVREC